jgi:cytochrome c-type biogenesis protein CcmH/NrfG
MDAVKHAKEATELDPKNSKAFYRLFKGYVDNQDLDGALSSIENAVKLEPNN